MGWEEGEEMKERGSGKEGKGEKTKKGFWGEG